MMQVPGAAHRDVLLRRQRDFERDVSVLEVAVVQHVQRPFFYRLQETGRGREKWRQWHHRVNTLSIVSRHIHAEFSQCSFPHTRISRKPESHILHSPQ